jgi:NADPH:quinone reductase-like Zn-dependent oxidoreductase
MISQALDYKGWHFEHGLRDIDVVFDTVGGETLNRWWGVLNHNGRLVTIAANNEATSDERANERSLL